MNLRTPEGGLVSVGDKLAQKLLARGYTRIDEEGAETQEDDWNVAPEGEDTPEPVQDAPALPEAPVATVRAWAKENDIEVSAKGRVSAEVYEKYAEAHNN